MRTRLAEGEMPALDHIIIPARDRWASARFLAGILGVQAGPQWGPFVPVRTGNGVTLDFMDSHDIRIRPQHCAFLVSDAEFDNGLARVRAAGVGFFAEPSGSGQGTINRLYGGRGFYFHDPDG